MTDQILTVADVQARARAAFHAGQPASACLFNWHAPAYATWHAEYARLKLRAELNQAFAALDGRPTPFCVAMGAAPPSLHAAPAGPGHVDARQVESA